MRRVVLALLVGGLVSLLLVVVQLQQAPSAPLPMAFGTPNGPLVVEFSTSRPPVPLVVLMSDSRDLFRYERDRSKPKYYELAAAINAQYCRATPGCEFRVYRPDCLWNSLACMLDGSDRLRSSAWARVQAVNATLWEYAQRGLQPPVVLYLDSDCYVGDPTVRLSRFDGHVAGWEDEIRGQLCTGAMLFGPTQLTLDLLGVWWNEANRHYDFHRKWDQDVWVQKVHRRFRRHVHMLPSRGWTQGATKQFWDSGVLLDQPMPPHAHRKAAAQTPAYRNFLRHFWMGNADRYRSVVMQDVKRFNATLLTHKHMRRCPHAASDRMYCLRGGPGVPQ